MKLFKNLITNFIFAGGGGGGGGGVREGDGYPENQITMMTKAVALKEEMLRN